MAILLVRHGQTVLNAARVIQWPDTPLSELGIEQARRVAARLRDFPVEQILVSDYARACMTADEIKSTTKAPTQTLLSLRERNFGDLRGISYDELEDEPFAEDYHPKNGESWPQFHERVSNAWSEIKAVAEHVQGDTVVVTHALVCHSLLERHVEPGPHVPAGASIQNTSLSIIEGGPPWVLERLACTLHLQT